MLFFYFRSFLSWSEVSILGLFPVHTDNTFSYSQPILPFVFIFPREPLCTTLLAFPLLPAPQSALIYGSKQEKDTHESLQNARVNLHWCPHPNPVHVSRFVYTAVNTASFNYTCVVQHMVVGLIGIFKYQWGVAIYIDYNYIRQQRVNSVSPIVLSNQRLRVLFLSHILTEVVIFLRWF